MKEIVVDIFGNKIHVGDIVLFKGNGAIMYNQPGIIQENSTNKHIRVAQFMTRSVYNKNNTLETIFYLSKHNLKERSKVSGMIKVVKEMINFDNIVNLNFMFSLQYTFYASSHLEEFSNKALNKVCRELNGDSARNFLNM